MGALRLNIFRCLIWLVTLHWTTADGTVSFPETSSAVPGEISNDQIFRIPNITQDIRYDPLISEWVAESVMHFAHDLAAALDTDESQNTQIFSPLSIMSALSIIHMGASGNSYNQLSKLFQLLGGEPNRESWKIHEEFGWLLEDLMLNRKNLLRPRKESAWRLTPANPNAFGVGGKKTPDDHIIRIANGLFVQEDFRLRQDYKNVAQSVYKSEVTPLDFRKKKVQAKHYINSWVNQNTLGKIPAIISEEIESDTSMIIASALYFKGFWEQPFSKSGTSEANFYPDGQSNPSVKVMMMTTGGVLPYYDSPEYNCRILGLPYKGNQTTMYIIQPHDSTRRNLNDLQKFLTGEKINELISKMEQKTAVLAFPKFHVTNTLHLKTPLIRMGIEDIFKNGVSDLSLIADAGTFLPSRSPASLQQVLSNSPPVTVIEPRPIFGSQPAASNNNDRQMLQQSGGNQLLDRFNEPPLIFSRFGEAAENASVTFRPQQNAPMQWTQQGDLITGKVLRQRRSKRTVTYKVESEFMRSSLPLRLKDLIVSKRITKSNPGKKLSRNRRQTAASPSAASLQNLDQLRFSPELRNPQLYVDDILHKVDFDVNEQGTEAAAATLSYLRRSGTDVAFRCDTPFLILIRHDPTKLPLFYGKVNIPL